MQRPVTAQERSARSHIVIYALLVAVSILLLAFSNTAQLQEVRRGVTYALAPIQETLAGGARAVSNVFSAVVEIESLKQENRDLKASIARLEQQNTQVAAIIAENRRLADLLRLKRSLDFQTVAAFVIGRGSTLTERVITLDKGSDDGLVVNDVVLSPGGAMVGAIAELTGTTATVRLLSDTRSLVIGKDVQTGATGEVRGKLSAPLSMERVPGTVRIGEGDTIVTADLTVGGGIRSLYPRNLLIGTIVDVPSQGQAQIEKTALIQPAADLDALEEVLVITSYKAPTIGPDPTRRPDATQKPRSTPKPR